MNVAAVKQALADAVAAKAIVGLNCYGYSPSAPAIPAFTVGAVTVDPNQTFGGSDVGEFTCTVLASAADDLDGQAALDRYLSRSGTESVREALLAARGEPGELALDGVADDLTIVRVDGYKLIQYAGDGATYYGADITVRVLGS